jgi:signal transduction histidine kinase
MVAQLGASSEKSIAQKVHLRSIIESALIIFMASHRKLIENVVFTPDLKAIDAVEIDRHFGNQLARVVTNLLNNAAEALVDTDPLREIKLTLWHSNGVLGIKVIDSGRGMSAETLSQALTGGYTSKTKGNGIGLSSSREWVTRNHGSFHIDSKLGHGTEITIEVPLERK